uniref:Uncharacterized protein n=1 Tax=uncultured prokaryote TaxID=198431 RepID=A0A0H5PWS8_9ZZZZ|nr:hypothetical protein [uncultured prokaryote]
MKYVGLGTTKKYLVVYIDHTVNSVNHPTEVRIPWWELTRDEIQYDINLAVAARLRSTWDEPQPPWKTDDALPGIG